MPRLLLAISSLLFLASRALGAEGDLRVSEVYTSKTSSYVIAVVEEETSVEIGEGEKHWIRTGDLGGIYFGEPSSGVLNRLTAIPANSSKGVTSTTYLGTVNIETWSYTLQLSNLGRTATLEIETAAEASDKTGDLKITCNDGNACLVFDDVETKLIEFERASGKMKLVRESTYRRLTHAVIEPESKTYYFVDFEGLSPDNFDNATVWTGPRQHLKPMKVKSTSMVAQIGARPLVTCEEQPTFLPSDGQLLEREGYRAAPPTEFTADLGQMTLRLDLADGSQLYIPGPSDHSMPRLVNDGEEFFLENVSRTPEDLFQFGYDMRRKVAEDFGICEKLFDK